jgi:hypothetical protein
MNNEYENNPVQPTEKPDNPRDNTNLNNPFVPREDPRPETREQKQPRQ